MKSHTRFAFTFFAFLTLCVSAHAQNTSATIKYRSGPITIDGVGDDPAWAEANEYSDFFTAGGDAPENDEDISAKWRALWDEDNLYFWIEVADSVLFTEDTNEWKDDSIELYLDADALGKGDDPVGDYRPVAPIDFFGPGALPIYQLTFIAGQDEIYNGTNHRKWVELHPNAELDADNRAIHEGKSIKSDTGYTMEIAFPWQSLGSSEVIDILKRTFFGVGIAINDNDLGGDRQTQIMWNTELGDLWNNPTSFPNVDLAMPEALPGPQILLSSAVSLGELGLAEPFFERTLCVMNIGTDGPLAITDVSVSGPDAGAVTIDEVPATVPSGGSAEIKYTLTPDRTGAFQFNIDVTNDDLDEADRMKSTAVSAAIINFAGPLAHLALDDAAGATEIRDISGNDNNGQSDGVELGVEALATGTAGSFSGEDYVEVSPPDIVDTESFSVALWANAGVLSPTQLVFGHGTGTPDFGLIVRDGKLSWFSDGDFEFDTDTTIATDTTYHLAVTYDGASTVTIYLDGAEVFKQEGANELSVSADPWYFGSFAGNLGFTGQIDDIQIYARQLAADEVKGIFDTPGVGGIPGTIDPGIDISGLVDVTSPADEIVRVDGTNDGDADGGDPPGAEMVENAINDQAQKYLNFKDLGSGFTVTPAGGLSVVSAIRLYTANDSPERDPGSYRLEGVAGDEFILISEGLLDMPDDRNGSGAEALDPDASFNQVVTFENSEPYGAYRLTFPALKDADTANSMQIAEVELLGVSYTPPVPVVYYNFNEGSGTTIGNAGSGPDGELVNAHAGAWVADGSPDGSGYLNFTQDGDTSADSQHVLTGLDASAIPVSGDVDYTMMAWARFDNLAPGGNSEDNMIFGQLSNDNVLHNGARASNYHMGHWGNDTNGGSVVVNEWHHVTWLYAAGVQTILVDGDPVISSEKGALAVESEVVIGATRGDEDRDFSGDLDEIRIYNAALPMTVIKDIAAGGGQVPGDPEPIPGLAGYWRFEEGSGGTVADSSGNGNDGTIIAPGSAWATDVNPFGSVYQSGGGSYVDLGNLVPVLGIDGDFTWTFWVNSEETGNNNIVFGNRYMADGNDFAPREFIKFTPTKFEWHFDGAGQDVNNDDTPLPTGQWVHNLVVKSGSTLTYYRDGQNIGTSEVTGGPVNTQPLYIGGQPNAAGDAAENFVGLFDEVAVFDRALSEAEVTDVYNRGLNGQSLGGGETPVEPGALSGLTDIGFDGNGNFSLSVPTGETLDIQYSQDMIDWETIATGITGPYVDTDPTRNARPEGYYRGVKMIAADD